MDTFGGRAPEETAAAGLLLLLAAGRTLDAAVDDVAPALQDLADACVPAFTDVAAIELVDEAGRAEVAGWASRPDAGLALGGRWEPVGADFVDLPGAALHPEPPDGLLGGQPVPLAARAALGALCDRIDATSAIVAPLFGGGVLLGWLCCANGRGRSPLHPGALVIIDEIARQVGAVVQRSLLYRDRAAGAELKARTARRLHRLAAAATNLAGAASPGDVLQVAALEACLITDGQAAAIRWEVDGRVLEQRSTSGADHAWPLLEGVLAGGPDLERGGWVLRSLPCGIEGHRAAVAVAGPLQDSAAAVLESFAPLVPVAFERALVTDETQRQRQRLQAILDASPVALVETTADGAVQGCNDAADRLFGWSGAAGVRLFPAAIAPRMRRLALDALAQPFTAVEVAAEDLDLSVSGSPLQQESSAGAILAIADLAEQRQIQRRLLQAQRLEAMGQVAGGLAHDFNNLLTVMLAATAGLRHLPGDAEHAAVEAIERAAGRAAELTGRLLSFSRSDGEDVAGCDAAAIVRDLKPIIGRVVGPMVLFDACVPTDAVPTAADAAEVEQIVVNLALNAADAMAGRGSLHVRVSILDLSSDEADLRALAPGRFTRLEVTDDGPGMDDATLARCLDPFFTTKPVGTGSGLGLSTIYALASERRGHLAIDSAPGHGTSVVVHLPAAAGVMTEPAPSADRPASIPPGTVVLVTESEVAQRRLAVQALAAAGADVVVATTGREAVRLAAELERLDVLVSAALLADLSGHDVAARLRSTRPDLPALLVTGWASRDPHVALPGGISVLRKPYAPDDLVRAVAAANRRGQGSNR